MDVHGSRRIAIDSLWRVPEAMCDNQVRSQVQNLNLVAVFYLLINELRCGRSFHRPLHIGLPVSHLGVARLYQVHQVPLISSRCTHQLRFLPRTGLPILVS